MRYFLYHDVFIVLFQDRKFKGDKVGRLINLSIFIQRFDRLHSISMREKIDVFKWNHERRSIGFLESTEAQ